MRDYRGGMCKLTAIPAAAGLAVLIAACGASARPAADTWVAASGTASPGEGAVVPRSEGTEYVNLIDLAAPGLGLVGLGTGAQGTGSARLVVSRDNGRTFTAIGPATAAGTTTDDVFFRDREVGWFVVFNLDTTADTLYRTTDGGHTWRASSVVGHVIAAGSQDSVQFVSGTHGWLLSLQPTGPLEALAVTSDGGATWHWVSSLYPTAGEGLLPKPGLVRFTSGTTGWLGGDPYSQALYRTVDGGRTWRHVDVPAPPGSLFGLPVAVGRTVIEPVITGTSLALYRSSDDGARWSRISVLPGANAEPGCSITPVSVSLPSPAGGWIATVRDRRTVVYRTVDGGRHWARVAASWPVAPGTCEAPVIQSTGTLQAWVLTAGSDRIYATSSGGAAWSRIDTAAVAAR